MNGESGNQNGESGEIVIRPEKTEPVDEVTFEPEILEPKEEKDDTELLKLIEITEGGEIEREDGKHRYHNLRQSFYIATEKRTQMVDFSDYTSPSSPVRDMVLRRYGGASKLGDVIRAYDEIFIPKLLERIEEEFEEFERKTKQGLSDPTHFELSAKVDTARLYVKYLRALKDTVDRENEALEKERKSKELHQEIIERVRGVRKEDGKRVTKIFDECLIKIYPRGEEREVASVEYAVKIGAKLEKGHYAQMSDEEIDNTKHALANFRKRLVEVLPKNEDRQILLEEWEEKEKNILAEIDELYRARLHHELSDKEQSEMETKKSELHKTEQVIRVLQRSTF